MALKFLFHFTLSVFVFSDKKTTRGHHRGLMLRSYSRMNRKTNDYDFWLRVDGSIEPCLQIIQVSFDGYTAATIREVPNTYSMKECFFAKNYHENEFIDSPVSNDMTARFNITDEYEFMGAGQKCKDITQCATPHICAPEGKEQDLKCTNNKVGVLPGFGFKTDDDPKKKLPQHFFMRNTVTGKYTTASVISSLFMDPAFEIGALPEKK